MPRIDDDSKAHSKKELSRATRIRTRRLLNGKRISSVTVWAYSVIDEALNNSCHTIESEKAATGADAENKYNTSVVSCVLPYESIYECGIVCGRRQFHDYRKEFTNRSLPRG